MKKQKKSRTNNYQLDFDYCVQSLKREQDKRTKERHTQLTQLSNYALFVVCVRVVVVVESPTAHTQHKWLQFSLSLTRQSMQAAAAASVAA